MGPCWGHDRFAMTLQLKCLDYFPCLYDCNTDGKRDLRNYDDSSSLMCLGIVPPVYQGMVRFLKKLQNSASDVFGSKFKFQKHFAKLFDREKWTLSFKFIIFFIFK